MAEISGVVNSIIYRNTENGWTVLELCPDEGEKLTVVGALPLANVGERLELTGANGGPVVIKGYISVSPDDWDTDGKD